jgi:hypothetical protein
MVCLHAVSGGQEFPESNSYKTRNCASEEISIKWQRASSQYIFIDEIVPQD